VATATDRSNGRSAGSPFDVAAGFAAFGLAASR
jgi:hypothetical protein